MATENPITAVENLAPRALTNHFRDNKIVITPWGLKFTGAAVGEGDLDMKRSYELIRQNPDMNRINIELDLECPMTATLPTENDDFQIWCLTLPIISDINPVCFDSGRSAVW